MNQIRRFRKNKDATQQKINKIKSTILKLSLIMLNFIFATFAWFTYTQMLNPAIDVNVSTWQVNFKDNEGSLGTSMQFQVGEFYPGMEDYKKQIEIVNLGDRGANITYRIDTLKILGQEYIVKEIVEEGDKENTIYAVETTNIENGTKIVKILNDSTKFPFEIILTYTSEIQTKDLDDENKNKGTFEICFTWPYEIEGTEEEVEAKNTLDTQWGHNIANFYQGQQGENQTQGIEITLQAVAEQII